jgi:hypothetical protein
LIRHNSILRSVATQDGDGLAKRVEKREQAAAILLCYLIVYCERKTQMLPIIIQEVLLKACNKVASDSFASLHNKIKAFEK